MEAACSLFWLAGATLAANGDGVVAGPLRGFLTRANQRVWPGKKGAGIKEMVEIVVDSVAAVLPASVSLSLCTQRTCHDPPNPFLSRSLPEGAIARLSGEPPELRYPAILFLSFFAPIVVICIQSTVGHLVVSAGVCHRGPLHTLYSVNMISPVTTP